MLTFYWPLWSLICYVAFTCKQHLSSLYRIGLFIWHSFPWAVSQAHYALLPFFGTGCNITSWVAVQKHTHALQAVPVCPGNFIIDKALHQVWMNWSMFGRQAPLFVLVLPAQAYTTVVLADSPRRLIANESSVLHHSQSLLVVRIWRSG